MPAAQQLSLFDVGWSVPLVASSGTAAPATPAASVPPEPPAGPAAGTAPPPPDLVGLPRTWRHPRANRECLLGDCLVAYEFQRGRRRTIGLTVGHHGLSVRAPRWTPLPEVEAFVRSKADWVLQKLAQADERQRQSAQPMRWEDGAPVPYLGGTLRLVLDPSHARSSGLAQLADGCLVLALAHDAGSDRIRDAAQAWLMRRAELVFTERLNHFAVSMGVMYTRLRLSSAGTRWGSASTDGSIRLNWRLIHLSQDIIDYVVVHELSHLREMNHSPDFWQVVGSVMPDYALRRRALRQVRLAGE